MKWVKRILLGVAVLLLLAVAGGTAFALVYGHPPALRPDLVTALPDGVPAPPAGYPTEILSFAAGWFLYEKVPWKNVPDLDGVTRERDIEFGKGGDTPLLLDLYTPANVDGQRPGVLLFYGGGWEHGDREQLRSYALAFAKHGYVVAVPQYRLKVAGRFPNSVQDAKCAVRWMRAHAGDIHVDPNRIGIMGNSAGAYLALMVGYTPDVPEFEGDGGWPDVSSAVQAVVDVYGPVDFCDPERNDHPLLTNYLNAHWKDNQSIFEKASPIRYLTPKSPPTCVIHGTVDMLVPVTQSDLLVERLAKDGIKHVYSRIDGWPHAMDFVLGVHQHTEALILHFLDEQLGGAGAAAPKMEAGDQVLASAPAP